MNKNRLSKHRKHPISLGLSVCLALVLGLASASPAMADEGRPDGPGGNQGRGRLYAMTNDDARNEVLVYERARDGSLKLTESVATDGKGLPTEPDDALGSQNPLILSGDGKWLFAVNAGSNSISTFRVKNRGIELASVTPSGGNFPASLTIHDKVLYVLNSGGDGNITGFALKGNGRLEPLDGSTRSLNAGGANPPFFLVSPAQVGFSPSGDQLVVTVKGVHPVHQIHTFAVDRRGLPSDQPVTTTSTATLPFGFGFDRRGNLIVAEPFGNRFTGTPAPGLSAVSSYRLRRDGTIEAISTSIANQQTATCWLAVTPDGRFAYTTNNASGTISSYRIAGDGSLTLLAAVAATAGSHPVDLVVTDDGSHLYNVNAGDGSITIFEIGQRDGGLTPLGSVGGLPDDGSAVGIAVQ